ncbi:hypothetical protein TNCV_676071 [Trichonephila clavipes]|nr:hypothetical protein TNCV_676071 [Trichonephila clavipes]
MNPELRNEVVFKTTSVCTNSSMTFAAAWTLSSETIAVATLDAASQTGAASQWGSAYSIKMVAWWHRDERTLAECIRHRHTGPSPGMMI